MCVETREESVVVFVCFPAHTFDIDRRVYGICEGNSDYSIFGYIEKIYIPHVQVAELAWIYLIDGKTEY